MKMAPSSCQNVSVGEQYVQWVTNRFGHILWQVRDVEIGRLVITLGLKTRIERLLNEVSRGYGMTANKESILWQSQPHSPACRSRECKAQSHER